MERLNWLTCGLLCLVPLWASGAEIEVGSPMEEVLAEFGDPEMQYARNGDTILYYLGLEVVVRDGAVVRIPSDLADRISGRRAERKVRTAQSDASGRAARNSRAAKTTQRTKVKPESVRLSRVAASSPAKVVSNGGARVNLRSLMKPGHVTLVDFYADWCGPCRQLAPLLNALAAEDPRIDLVKIDIVKWGTPVTQQFKIDRVPNVRVYNAAGKRVGTPSHNPATIQQNIRRAKGA